MLYLYVDLLLIVDTLRTVNWFLNAIVERVIKGADVVILSAKD